MSETKSKRDEISIEEMFQSLDGIVSNLESEDISLEESFALYNKGMSLLKECNGKIDTVEKKMKVLDEDGKEQDF